MSFQPAAKRQTSFGVGVHVWYFSDNKQNWFECIVSEVDAAGGVTVDLAGEKRRVPPERVPTHLQLPRVHQVWLESQGQVSPAGKYGSQDTKPTSASPGTDKYESQGTKPKTALPVMEEQEQKAPGYFSWLTETVFGMRSTLAPPDWGSEEANAEPDDHDYHWLFVFPLPTKETERFLNKDPARILVDAFRAALAGDDDEAKVDHDLHEMLRKESSLESEKGDTRGKSRTRTLLEEPLLKAAGKLVGGGEFRHVEDCAILIFIEILKMLDDHKKESLKNRHGTDDHGDHFKMKIFPDAEGKQLLVGVNIGMLAAEHIAERVFYPVSLSKAANKKWAQELENLSPPLIRYSSQPAIREVCHRYRNDEVLRNIDLVRLFNDKLTDFVDLLELEKYGLLNMATSLHNIEDLQKLEKVFTFRFNILLCGKQDPIEKIRQYFGEEIAFYFLFLQTLAWWVLYLTLPALIATIAQSSKIESSLFRIEDPDSRPETYLGFAIVLIIWFRCFTLAWYRTQAEHEISWGLSMHRESSMKERPNLRFHGDDSDKFSGSIERLRGLRNVGLWRKVLGRWCSMLLTATFALALIGLCIRELSWYNELNDLLSAQSPHGRYEKWELTGAQKMLSSGLGAVTGCQIKIVDGLWDKISNLITDLECRQTESQFLASKRAKATLINFITSTSPLLFFTFWRASGVENHSEFVQHQLGKLLMTTFVTRYIVLGSVNRILKSFFMLSAKRRFHKEKLTTPFIELQGLMTPYLGRDFNNDFLDAILPLSMVVMFSTAAPASVFLLLLAVVVQFSCDAWKLTHTYQRPYPNVQGGIGTFNDFFELFGRVVIFLQVGICYRIYPRIVTVPESVFNILGIRQVHEQTRALVFFLTLGISVTWIWTYAGWLVPKRSRFAERQHDLHIAQRRELRLQNMEVLDATKPKVDVTKLPMKTDFANPERRPEPSLSTRKFLCDGKEHRAVSWRDPQAPSNSGNSSRKMFSNISPQPKQPEENTSEP